MSQARPTKRPPRNVREIVVMAATRREAENLAVDDYRVDHRRLGIVLDAAALPRGEDDLCPNCVTPWKCNGPHDERYRRWLVEVAEWRPPR